MATTKHNAKTTKSGDPIQQAVEGLHRDPSWNERYSAAREATVLAIAREILGIETLETRFVEAMARFAKGAGIVGVVEGRLLGRLGHQNRSQRCSKGGTRKKKIR